jgi:hypothetical protein
MAKRSGLIASLLILAVLLSGCDFQIVPKMNAEPQAIVKTKFAGDYPTLQLRGMWAYCSQAFRLNQPYTPPELVANMCDCYVDKMRETYNANELEGLSESESKSMGQKLIKTCNPKPKGQKI